MRLRNSLDRALAELDTRGVVDLPDVAVRVMAGEIASEELPMIAAVALVEGQDSPALRQLAGLSRSEYREARELLAEVLEELSLPEPPDEEQAHWHRVRFYAGRITAGLVNPVDGAHAIAWHTHALMYPDALAPFVYLADEWEEYPQHRTRLERDIVGAAQKVLDA